MLIACDPIQINNTRDAYELLTKLLLSMDKHDRDKECFWTLMLDNQNNLRDIDLVYLGSADGIQVTCREIFRLAVEKGAMRIILAHNHPSMNVEPSKEDVLFCRKVRRAGQLLSIPMVDFMIFTPKSYWSLTFEGASKSHQELMA